eukprot:CAMPEP_0184752548 /NCGR_PEP_ID=MMETSP0315-20130426/43634_1 /TAXON_ID=101924 /ORGANISM="Rhodosorus marinus, Strain UTEX LB 2760" /LENGTH=363 /DNA_ID=CAMNT_0027231883 /DNA_START=418 /DNA_END=1509 /DNA_ORIENTATION=-
MGCTVSACVKLCKGDQEPDEEETIRTSEDFHGLRLHFYRIRQQESPTLIPILRPAFVITFYYLLFCIFVAVGVVLIIHSGQIVSLEDVRYDNVDSCNVGDTSDGTTNNCQVEIEVTETLKAPFYVYYGLTNFHQNHRRYVSSRNSLQLAGEEQTDEQLSSCDPIVFFPNGTEIIPCGLTAWSRFNDTFTFCKDTGCQDQINWTDQGIAWESDEDVAFQPGPWTDAQNELINSPDFIVWMRLASFDTFTKLYRIVNEDLAPGTYFMDIGSNYPVSGYDGTKFIAITETSWFGTRKTSLGIIYLAMCGCLFVIATALLLRHLIKPRRLAYEDLNLVKEYLVKTVDMGDEEEKQKALSQRDNAVNT